MPFEQLKSAENPKIKDAVRLLTNASHRTAQNRFICEGLRLVRDAVQSGVTLHEVFVTEQFCQQFPDEVARIAAAAAQVYCVTPSLLQKISDTRTPQGICAVGTLPALPLPQHGRLMVCDRLQDPANLGALARTAEAFGIDGLLLSADSCAPHNPKALRASMGAFFRLPTAVCDCLPEALCRLREQGFAVFGSVVRDETCCLTELTFPASCALVIGNEANGVSDAVLKACDQRVTIRMAGRAESLNASAAATVFMWEMTKGGACE